MLFYDNKLAPNPLVVRLFIMERGGLELDVQSVDIFNTEQRRLAYRTQVNKRGEIPALRLDDGTVITESVAICKFLDEVAAGGHSLFGSTPTEKATTLMWLRRMDIDIVQPLSSWFRNGEETIDFYRGHRIPDPSAKVIEKVRINQALNQLDDELEGKHFLCGDRFSAADVLLYGMTQPFLDGTAPWVNAPGRLNVAAWFDRMGSREASQKAIAGFGNHVSV
ncbi:Glutathione S-transferase 2 [Colletotrichum higginsianum]|uniref:Glutathione S-transferase 2 n=1 Tax=Colletotrichum higginsianum TaxID=80884 RepID=A0A4V4NA61_9PEZI|nr:Glutathione S-transferase 2 [Colletotrichum higginsianum]